MAGRRRLAINPGFSRSAGGIGVFGAVGEGRAKTFRREFCRHLCKRLNRFEGFYREKSKGENIHMKRLLHRMTAAMLALVMSIGLLSGGALVARADSSGGAASAVPSPIVGAPNAAGTGAEVTFQYQGGGNETSVTVKGEFDPNWGINTPLIKDDQTNVWSVTRTLPAGWYEYGMEADGGWVADPANPVRKNGNPGVSVPGVHFSGTDEFALGTTSAFSAVYYSGHEGDKYPVKSLVSSDHSGVSVAGDQVTVAPDAAPGTAHITAVYGDQNGTEFTVTCAVTIVAQVLASPVVNGDGTVTFSNKTSTSDKLYLVGDMNGWDPAHGIEMTKGADGVFRATIPLDAGSYGYKFVPGLTWGGDFTDPLNPRTSNGNSLVVMPGIKITSGSDVQKGAALALTAKMVDSSGTETNVSPIWSLAENKPGISISGSELTVAPDYVPTAGDYVTVIATSGGYTARKQISVQDKMYTFNLHYYRYDEQLDGWDNWVFKAGVMDGTEYDFTGKDADGFATVTIKLPISSITTIQRPGNWSSQDLTRDVAVPDGETAVEAWIVEGKANVFYNRDDALTAKADVPVKRYVELRYVRADQDYTGWNLWVWNTGAKNDEIDFAKIENGVAVARIEIGPNTQRIGFKVRKGDWAETDVDTDRYIDTPLSQTLTKATVTSGRLALDVLPAVDGPVLRDGGIAFYYRDDALFAADAMDTIDGVQVKVTKDGVAETYDMTYVPEQQFFTYTLAPLAKGHYTYAFLVNKGGSVTETADPRHAEGGVSAFDYDNPQLQLSATISPQAVSYDENAVLSLSWPADQTAMIAKASADLSALGGPSEEPIDLSLGELSIAVADNVAPGAKTIPVTAIDIYGNKHTSAASVLVKKRQPSGALDFDWDEARIYFLLTDRFFDGDASNDYNVDKSHPEAYHGGDFKGLTEKLDYLQDLGVNTIWITPIVDNIDFNQGVSFGGTQYAYHGYWAQNFEAIDEHLGDLNDFKTLIDQAHDKGMKIMVDVVLNHAGYGVKTTDTNPNVPQAVKDRFDGMLRTDGSGMDEVQGELAGLPDFRTEDPAVRDKLIAWQSAWLDRARTARGDTIDYFRVDTVKNVDDTTWKAFKSALTALDPKFKMIGEYYGAGIDAQGGQLRSGQMDSLLDFEYKSKAEAFAKGGIDGVESYLEHRAALMDNTATMGQFLSSHDEDGFLSSRVGGDKGMLKVAAALQITDKGQPIIYYGEELGQSGKKGGDFAKGEYSENRDDMPWNRLTDPAYADDQALHDHYKKLLHIRADYSKVFAKGTRTKTAGGDGDGYLVFDRAYEGEHVLVGLNTTAEAKTATFDVPYAAGQTVTDRYSGSAYTVDANRQVTVTLPSRDEGGTVVLTGSASAPNPGSSSAGGTTNGSGKGVVKLSESDLRAAAADDKHAVDVAAAAGNNGTLRIELPANASDLLGAHPLTLQAQPYAINLPASVLAALQNAIPASDRSGSSIVLTVAAASPEQAQARLQAAERLDSAGLRQASGMLDLRFSLLTPGGEEQPAALPDGRIGLTLKLDSQANAKLLGIYRIGEDGTLTYVGGTVSGGAITASAAVPGTYVALEYTHAFDDVPASFWGADDIAVMAAKHIVRGVSAAQFQPNGRVTRAEFAAMLVRALGLTSSGAANPFADVSAGKWYAADVAAARETGLASGKDGSRFDPDGAITRQEMAVMIARALQHLGKDVDANGVSLDRFSDAGSVSGWADESVRISLQTGIVRGADASRLLPGADATRAEATAMLRRLLEYAELLNK